MDILSNKSTKEFDYISRYAGFYTYYNTLDDKYVQGLTNQLDDSIPYVLHNVKKTDDLDYLSNYYYGRPDYFWIIADFNRIQDPFINLYENYKTLKIPSVGDLKYINQ